MRLAAWWPISTPSVLVLAVLAVVTSFFSRIFACCCVSAPCEEETCWYSMVHITSNGESLDVVVSRHSNYIWVGAMPFNGMTWAVRDSLKSSGGALTKTSRNYPPKGNKGRARRESNPQPRDPKSRALSVELRAQGANYLSRYRYVPNCLAVLLR